MSRPFALQTIEQPDYVWVFFHVHGLLKRSLLISRRTLFIILCFGLQEDWLSEESYNFFFIFSPFHCLHSKPLNRDHYKCTNSCFGRRVLHNFFISLDDVRYERSLVENRCSLNMTYNSAKVARVAIAHIIIGGLLVCLGIALRVASTSLGQDFAVLDYSAIWIGIWVSIVCGLVREYVTCFPSFIVTFKLFSGWGLVSCSVSNTSVCVSDVIGNQCWLL